MNDRKCMHLVLVGHRRRKDRGDGAGRRGNPGDDVGEDKREQEVTWRKVATFMLPVAKGPMGDSGFLERWRAMWRNEMITFTVATIYQGWKIVAQKKNQPQKRCATFECEQKPARSWSAEKNQRKSGQFRAGFSPRTFGCKRCAKIGKTSGILKVHLDRHIVSYYTASDIISGQLKRPTAHPDIMNIFLDSSIFHGTNFRIPPKIEQHPDGRCGFIETEEPAPHITAPAQNQPSSSVDSGLLSPNSTTEPSVFYGAHNFTITNSTFNLNPNIPQIQNDGVAEVLNIRLRGDQSWRSKRFRALPLRFLSPGTDTPLKLCYL
ncbi:hypothetical protein R3P38DRAFT_2791558 [Favolaschia claudopus]|uniref:C2H2-type domain-containing protein n=1 Tax=Favolaschia claudopus TaxID=2862362 RepID=A0AAW0AH62_9AGAR